jgi:hypothetical protein
VGGSTHGGECVEDNARRGRVAVGDPVADRGQPRYGPAQTGFSPVSGITPENVGTLHTAFTVPDAHGIPLAHDGRVYTSDASDIEVYDGAGKDHCAGGPPAQCTPLWRYAGGNTDNSLISGHTLFGWGNVTAAYDADGQTNCAGTVRTCSPLRTYVRDDDNAVIVGVTATADVLYALAHKCLPDSLECRHADPISGVIAYDAHGVTNCAGTPVVCHPLWSSWGTRPGYVFVPIAVAAGRVYLTEAGDILVFDAAGTTNCGGTPKTCAPIATIAASDWGDALPIAGGTAFLSPSWSLSQPLVYLDAYDAAGGTTPLWSSSAPVTNLSPAVGGGRVFAESYAGGDTRLVAFDAAGNTNCGGSPKVCAPLFSALAAPSTQPSNWDGVVGGGDVVFVSTAANLTAFDARGEQGCGGTPTTCNALYSRAVQTLPHPTVSGDFLYYIEVLSHDPFTTRLVALTHD